MQVRESGLVLPRMRGHGRIELFDDRTGRKRDEMPFENVVTDVMTEHVRRRVGDLYGRGFGGQDANASMENPFWQEYSWFSGGTSETNEWNAYWARAKARPPGRDPMYLIACTTDARVEAATERAPLFNSTVVAYANKATYAGADTRRGSPNLLEADLSHEDYVRMVFDWSTAAGNGTFRSVLMCDIVEGLSTPWGYADHLSVASHPDYNGFKNLVPPTGGSLQYYCSVTQDPLTSQWYLWTWDGIAPSGYKPHPINLATKVVGAPLSGTWPTGEEVTGAACDGTNFFVAREGTGTIKRYGMTGGLNSTISGLTTPKGPCIVGNSLFYVSGAETLVEIHKDTGAAIATLSLPGLTADGHARISYRADLDMLYVCGGGSNRLVRVTRGPLAALDAQYFDMATAPGNITFDEERDGAFLTFSAYNGSSDNEWSYVRWDRSVGSRSRLAADLTKTSSQTMKITYQFDYV